MRIDTLILQSPGKALVRKTFVALISAVTVLSAQTISLTGTVTDCSGSPVSGAAVTLASLNLTVETDENGVYEMIHTVSTRDKAERNYPVYMASSRELILNLAAYGPVPAVINDVNGRLIERLHTFPLDGGRHRLALPELKSGIFFITVTSGAQQYGFKLLFNSSGSFTLLPEETTLPLAKQSAAVDSLEIIAAGYRVSTVPVDNLTGTVDDVLMTDAEFAEGDGECPADALYLVTFAMIHTGLLIVFPNGETMLVDTAHSDGPPKMMNFMTYHGINHVDYVQISHNHGDHFGGIDPLTDAGFITDETHMEDCQSYEVGDRFERAGTSWYIYNSDRGDSCGDNDDSLSYWMWYNGFRLTGGGDEGSVGKRQLVENSSLDLDEFFPVDVRYENHHCNDWGDDWYDPFEELLNAKYYICTNTARERADRVIPVLESRPRLEYIIQQKKIHIFKVYSADNYEAFFCDNVEDCPVELPQKQ